MDIPLWSCLETKSNWFSVWSDNANLQANIKIGISYAYIIYLSEN